MIGHKLGPGRLTFGATGSLHELSAQLKTCNINPESSAEDDEFGLDWSALAGDTTDAATISGTFKQEYSQTSFIKWAHDNRGKVMPFEFVPVVDTKDGLKVTGKVQIVRVGFGGDVKKTNDQDFEFKIVGGEYELDEYAKPAA